MVPGGILAAVVGEDEEPQEVGNGASGSISDLDLLAFAQGELSEPERRRIELALDENPEQAEVLANFALIFGNSNVDLEDPWTEEDDQLHGTSERPGFDPRAGTQLGRYLLIGELGRGGMGVVFRAYDPKLQREVALKSLGPEALSSQAQERLVHEAQAMAKLSHRNVVAVYDVERLDDRFVLAMEYVEGMHLGEWVGRAERSWSEILAVYVEAGEGLAAAHAAGLLHRDFKPANVLISATGDVKVTDFGIARSDGLPERVESLSDGDADSVFVQPRALTEDGEVVGTPAFMSPEQLELRDVGPAADQYAFCVSLWLSLTGELPFVGSKRVDVGTLIELKKAGPPRWPSQASRVPRRFADAIVRGLSVESGERWPSMEALLSELRANPTQRWRRVAAVGALAGAVIGGIGWNAYARAERAEACVEEGRQIDAVWSSSKAESLAEGFGQLPASYGAESWERARPRIDAFAEDWAEVRTAVCHEAEVEGTRRPRVLALARSCLDEQRAMLGGLVEQWSEPDATVMERVGSVAWSLPRPRACADDDELQRRGETLDDPAARSQAQEARERMARARALSRTGRHAEARAEAGALFAEVREADRPRLVAGVQRVIAEAELGLGHYARAVEILEEAYEHAYVSGDELEALGIANRLSAVLSDRLARHEEARRWSWFTHLHQERLGLAEDHPAVSEILNNLGVIHLAMGEYDEALVAHQQSLVLREATLGPDHPDVALSLNNLGNVHTARADYEQARRTHERSLSIREAAFGPDHPSLAASLSNVGSVLNKQGEYAQALEAHRRALAILEQAQGPEHLDVAAVLNNVGITYESMGRYEQARQAHERALGIIEKAHGPDHASMALSLNNLGIVLRELGEDERALSSHERAIEIWRSTLDEDHPYLASARVNLGAVLHATGRYEEALTVHRQALGAYERTLDADHLYIGLAAYNVGLALMELGNAAEAIAMLQRARDVLMHGDAASPQLGEVYFGLARAHWQQGNRAEAIALANTAVDELSRLEPGAGAPLSEVRAWLRARPSG